MKNNEDTQESFFKKIIKEKDRFLSNKLKHLRTLKKECYYFLFNGKSIRTLLSGVCAKEINLSIAKIIPFCAAVELIQLYSIIHDDLPAMDNAITRRGKKSLHIAFGESAAILTGDLLQNKAYHIISEYYSKNKKLIDFFFETTADKGIIKGQVLDISYKLKNPPLNTLITIYKLKTGALFSLAASGPAFIKQLSEKEINKFKKIGEFIGITYQIKDDIQDRNIQLEPNIVRCIGLEKAQKLLNTYKAKLFKAVKEYQYLQKFIYKVFENAQNN